jgi:hypothetical protein
MGCVFFHMRKFQVFTFHSNFHDHIHLTSSCVDIVVPWIGKMGWQKERPHFDVHSSLSLSLSYTLPFAKGWELKFATSNPLASPFQIRFI